ncbi:unnamed protein product [Soboliphyme baturini]|uniref:DUF3265 domain-containing protein n=1 Tax=Soboliphyme baturini TaxID=241478 RepID=A0A183J588_9BILA|nr:unnamed protein product [Soboliphyme baturini]
MFVSGLKGVPDQRFHLTIFNQEAVFNLAAVLVL